MNRLSKDINVLCLVKGAERYIFLYDDQGMPETLRVMGRWASSPELTFTWHDAAVASKRLSDQQCEGK